MSTSHVQERRRHPRARLPFPARVEAVDDAGRRFALDTVLDDLSVGGLYVRVGERVREGSEVSVTARFSVVTDRGLTVRMTGKVSRVEPRPDGTYGVAVEVWGRQIL